MTRIAFIGAGSVEFTRNLLGDIFSFPELAGAEVVLHDIDEERLATAEAMARWTNDTLGAHARISSRLRVAQKNRGAVCYGACAGPPNTSTTYRMDDRPGESRARA